MIKQARDIILRVPPQTQNPDSWKNDKIHQLGRGIMNQEIARQQLARMDNHIATLKREGKPVPAEFIQKREGQDKTLHAAKDYVARFVQQQTELSSINNGSEVATSMPSQNSTQQPTQADGNNQQQNSQNVAGDAARQQVNRQVSAPGSAQLDSATSTSQQQNPSAMSSSQQQQQQQPASAFANNRLAQQTGGASFTQSPHSAAPQSALPQGSAYTNSSAMDANSRSYAAGTLPRPKYHQNLGICIC